MLLGVEQMVACHEWARGHGARTARLPVAGRQGARSPRLLAAVGVFLLVVLATFPVVVPFTLTRHRPGNADLSRHCAPDAVSRRLGTGTPSRIPAAETGWCSHGPAGGSADRSRQDTRCMSRVGQRTASASTTRRGLRRRGARWRWPARWSCRGERCVGSSTPPHSRGSRRSCGAHGCAVACSPPSMSSLGDSPHGSRCSSKSGGNSMRQLERAARVNETC
jgi:hypothetical protein